MAHFQPHDLEGFGRAHFLSMAIDIFHQQYRETYFWLSGGNYLYIYICIYIYTHIYIYIYPKMGFFFVGELVCPVPI